MLRVVSCIVNEHDHRLVLLAVLICAATSFTALHAFSHASREHGSWRLAWVFLAAVATGTGIWATHFVAMLAYEPGYPVGYDAVLTIASLLVAVVVAAVGLALVDARKPRGNRGRRRDHRCRHRPHAFRGHGGAGTSRCDAMGPEPRGSVDPDRRCALGSLPPRLARVGPPPGVVGRSGTAGGCHLRSALHGHGSGGVHPRSHDGVAWLQHRRCNAGNRGHGRKHRGDAGRAGGNADHQPGRAHGAAQQPGARRRGAGGSGHRARRHDRERQSPHPPAHAADLR